MVSNSEKKVKISGYIFEGVKTMYKNNVYLGGVINYKNSKDLRQLSSSVQ